ncbi:MAG: transcription elongation factor [Labilithrix sp.]|nr:transcription elongation factor [Labilithrix sp.]
MPEKKTIARARKAKREGKASTTQAGEFVREEIEHIREGKHGAKNAKQAIAIGLSKARRAGVKLPAAKGASTSERTRKEAKRGTAKAKPKAARRKSPKRTQSLKSPAAKRSRAATKALRRAPRASASHRALSRQARQAPRRRKRASGSRSRTKRAATAD